MTPTTTEPTAASAEERARDVAARIGSLLHVLPEYHQGIAGLILPALRAAEARGAEAMRERAEDGVREHLAQKGTGYRWISVADAIDAALAAIRALPVENHAAGEAATGSSR